MKHRGFFVRPVLSAVAAVLGVVILAACESSSTADPSRLATRVAPTKPPAEADRQAAPLEPLTQIAIKETEAPEPPRQINGGALGDTEAQGTPVPHHGDAPLDRTLQNRRDVVVEPGQFRQLLIRDAIAPIYEPQFIQADLANMDAKELVIGVAINGESKAYPVGPLNRREMVNDVVGGVPILVTW